MSTSARVDPLYKKGDPCTYPVAQPLRSLNSISIHHPMEIHTMNRRIRLSLVAIFAAMLFGTLTAAAQPLVWNPPCATLFVKDATGLGGTVTVVTTPPGLVGAVVVPPFGATGPFFMPVGATVDGITSLGGFFRPVIQPGPASPPAPIPSNGWIPNVTIGPPPGTCVDIYLDLTNCNIYIYPTGFAPPCRP